jgi:hypothetical protein
VCRRLLACAHAVLCCVVPCAGEAQVGVLDARGVVPVQGNVLVFPHGGTKGSLVHEGSAVIKVRAVPQSTAPLLHESMSVSHLLLRTAADCPIHICTAELSADPLSCCCCCCCSCACCHYVMCCTVLPQGAKYVLRTDVLYINPPKQAAPGRGTKA